MVAQELLFFRERARLRGFGFDRNIGGSDNERTVPGDGEENAAIRGFRDHERGISGEEGTRQNEMRSLADGQKRASRRGVERKGLLGVHARRINDCLGLQIEDRTVFAVACLNADDLSAAFDQARGFNVVNGRSAQILEGAQQRDGIAGIVELAVVVENASAKVVGCDARQLFERAVAGE